jgi:hypothetical protein
MNFILPVYRVRMDPHYVFHWMCHSVGIYVVESSYGRFLRFPNSIHLHYAFVSDPNKISTIFISYIFAVIQKCLEQQKTTEVCVCGFCNLYEKPKSKTTPDEIRALLVVHFANYIQYLQTLGRSYTDPLFLDQDFGLNDKKPDGVVPPSQYPTYFLSFT